MSKVKRLYVVSIDAMISEDFEHMKTLPNIGPYVRDASRIVNKRSVYPSLTLPCHATLMTGVYPNRHMVNHNEEFQPGNEHPPWFWYRSRYHDVPHLLDLAKENGYTTGCVFWSTCGGLQADWNLAEIWADGYGKQEAYDAMATGSNEFLDEVWPIIEPTIQRVKKPEYDYVCNDALCELIRTKKPEIVIQHVAYLDDIRHKKGVYAPEVYDIAWPHHDRLFGQVLDALRDIGELENTTIIITSDHGQTPVTHLLAPNLLFVRDGLIKLDEGGKLKDWDAYFFSAGHSCHVYLKDPSDKELEAKILTLIKGYAASGAIGIERILSKQEAEQEYHLTGDFTFVIEPTDGIAFNNRLTGELVSYADNSDYKYSVATHGHMPEKGPQPTFFLCGANVKKGVVVENADLVDEAPTIAALLGFEMKNVDGKVIKELL